MSALLGYCDQGSSVTPSDGTDLPTRPRAIYVGGTGDIVATMGGTDLTFKAVPVGAWLWISPTRIKATGTTATLMLALL
jgi:hypothetical protein